MSSQVCSVLRDATCIPVSIMKFQFKQFLCFLNLSSIGFSFDTNTSNLSRLFCTGSIRLFKIILGSTSVLSKSILANKCFAFHISVISYLCICFPKSLTEACTLHKVFRNAFKHLLRHVHLKIPMPWIGKSWPCIQVANYFGMNLLWGPCNHPSCWY